MGQKKPLINVLLISVRYPKAVSQLPSVSTMGRNNQDWTDGAISGDVSDTG